MKDKDFDLEQLIADVQDFFGRMMCAIGVHDWGEWKNTLFGEQVRFCCRIPCPEMQWRKKRCL